MRRFFSSFAVILAVLVSGTASVAAQTMATGGRLDVPRAGYGGAVAVSGGDVFVGEAGNVITSGAVYVYRKQGSGWVEVAHLGASDAFPADGFGTAVAVRGGTMLVSAGARDDGSGAVYVFERSESGDWQEVARLNATGVDGTASFGGALALGEGIALVGAPGPAPSRRRRGPPPTTVGEVFVFRYDGGSWTAQGSLGMGAAGDRFGASVSVHGDRMLVGAPGAGGSAGAVYAFRRVENEWRQAGALEVPGPTEGDRFGSSVYLEGDEALVAAPGRNGSEGVVFSFRFDDGAGQWTGSGRLLPFDGSQQDGFGTSMAVSGDEVWIGSPRAGGRRGVAYVFSGRVSEGWSRATKVALGELQSGDAFATTVDVDVDVAVVGVTGADFRLGSAAVFERRDGEWRMADAIMSEPEGFDAVTGGQVDCADGTATAFDCGEYDLMSFVPTKDMGGPRGVRVNDVWGWTDPDTGREYALVGRAEGTAFVDVTDAANPRYVGQLLMTEGSNPSVWRDIKVYRNHAYIVADGAGQHGVQVFDLTQLRGVRQPVTFDETAHYDGIASAHNIVINEEAGFAYTVGNSAGGETCGGGLHIINIQEPANPIFAGCFADAQTGRASTGYTHDAQCVTYHGPDQEHAGKAICLSANETALSIADVTDPGNAVALSRATYPDVGYAHQGWLTEDHRYFYMNDELDEIAGQPKTRTLIWDVTDLDDPQLVKEHFGTQEATDHNLYIRGNLMYQSNYRSGLRVLDIADPENPVEIGYFDTVPYGDNSAGMGGAWSNYPFFKSGIVIVTSGNEGLFIVKKRNPIT